ncbi:MAG: alpha/beta hydrolase [Epsilonproteobacteria bacterium]|nr:alpha/beta hydrolase [Campylobacterota bacterium]
MMNCFQDYLKDFKLLFLDLPGFGNSDITISLKTSDYAKIIELFLNSLEIKKQIIFGHSFGGKVATLLNPDILVLLSSAGIINKKSLKTRVKIKIYKTLKPIFGNSLYKLFATKDVDDLSKSMYETLKNVVNEDFAPIFSSFKKRALIYWGKDDKIVPINNAEQINTCIKNSVLRIYPGDHFFFLNNAEQICKDFREDQ